MSFARSFRLGILSLGALLFLAPYIFMLSTAAKSQQDIFSSSLSLIPHNWALWDNLAKAMSRVPMGLLLFNGVVVCALVLVFQVVVAIPCAYAMAKLKFRGQRAMMMMVMLGLLVPIHATALPFYVGFNQLGVLNSYFALSAPFFISIFSVVVHWNDLFWPLIVVNGMERATPPLGLLYFRAAEAGDDYGALMAATLIITLPLLLAFLAAQRRFIEGITLTGLKG